MNLVDQQTINAMQQSLGYHPFGSPGFSAAFGGLPAATQLSPGLSYLQGGTFFGPQLPNPYHLSFGAGFGGQGLGLAAEQFTAARGYQYMPRGIPVADVLQGREFERGLRRAVGVGEELDERRLARAIELGFKAAMGYTDASTAAHAGAMAQLGFRPLQAAGFFQNMPGGSAADFSRHMFLAAQNMRDVTRDRYQLGLGEDAAISMVNRLQDFFAPRGRWDSQRMRGLGFGEMGQLAAGLTSYGLLRTDVDPDAIEGLAERLGLDASQLSDTSVETLRGSAQSAAVGKQLQAYADVVGTMREILGAPDAPIPRIINELQQMTGGTMQEMDPNTVQQLLYKVRETARAANVSMTMMTEVVKESAGMAQQMGMSPIVGGQIAMQATAAMVASQTMRPGVFEGRLSPDREFNLRQQWMTRGANSAATRTSVQTQILLSEIDRGTLTPEQQSTYDAVLQQAQNLGWDETNMTQLRQRLTTLGIGSARALNALRSSVGVDRFLENNPDMLGRIFGAQIAETERDLGRAAQQFYATISTSPNDRLGQQLRAAADASGMGINELMSRIGESYAHAPGGTVAERMRWLREQGIDIGGLDGRALFTNLERDPRMQFHIRGRGVTTDRELAQLISREKHDATQQMTENIGIAVSGRNLLADLDVDLRGDAFERVMGAMARGKTDLSDIMTTAFGFMPTREVTGRIEQAHLDRMRANMQRLDEAKAAVVAGTGTQANVDKIQEAMDRDAAALQQALRPFEGLGRTKPLRTLLDTLDRDVINASRTAVDRSAAAGDRMAALRKLAETSTSWTKEQIAAAAAGIGGRTGRAFKAMAGIRRRESETLLGKMDEWQQAIDSGDTETATRIEQEILSDDYLLDTLGDMVTPRRMLYNAEQAELSRDRDYTPREQAELFNRIQYATESLKRVGGAITPGADQERRAALSQLQGLWSQGARVLFERDEYGGLRVNEKFLRNMVMLDKKYADDPFAAEKRVAELKQELLAQRDIFAQVTGRPEHELGVHDIAKMAFAIQNSGFTGTRVIRGDIFEPEALDPALAREIKSGSLIAMSQDIQRQITQAERNGDTALANKLRQNLQMARAYEDLNALRDTLSTSDFQGLGQKGRRGLVRDLANTIQDSALFNDKRRVSQAAVRMLYGMEDADSAAAMIQALNELQQMNAGEHTDMAIRSVLDRAKKDLTDSESTTTTIADDAVRGGSLEVTFRDARTGEDLGSGVTIEVGTPGQNLGREASQKAVGGTVGTSAAG